MEVTEVHESRFLLATVLAGAAFFGIFLGGFLITSCKTGKSPDACTLLIIGGLLLLCLLLAWNLLRRKLILYADHFCYFPAFGHKRTFSYKDIQAVKVVPFSRQFQIISVNGKKLASFEANMPGYGNVLSYLEQKGIPFWLPQPQKDISPMKRKAQKYKEEETAFILSRWSHEKILQERKAAALFRHILAVLCALSLFMPLRGRINVNLFILLCHFGLYLWMYPKMVFAYEKNSDDGDCRMPYPIICTGFSLIILLSATDNMNFDLSDIFLPAAFPAATLLTSYALVLLIKRRRESAGKILLVTMAVLLLSLTVTPALNRVLTFKDYSHETVTVLGKSFYRSSSNTNYYLQIMQNDTIKKLNVSKSLYDSASEGAFITLCRRKSLLGLPYQVLHK